MTYILVVMTALVAFFAFQFLRSRLHGGAYTNLDASAFADMMKQHGVEIIDVRTPAEVKSGSIPGAKHFLDVSSPDFLKNISKLDPEKTYLLYCRSGARSSMACNLMAKHGFKHLYNLSGGMQTWKSK